MNCRTCQERPEHIAGLCSVCWNASCKRYVEGMNAIPPERKQHALCDHANDYCCAPSTR